MRKIICIVLLAAMFLGVCTLSAGALDSLPDTGENSQRLWNNLNLSKVGDFSDVIGGSQPVCSFDVSGEGRIALLIDGNYIIVLSADGQVTDIFRFNCMGMAYIRWHGENMMLFIERGGYIFEFTAQGEYIGVMQAKDSGEQSRRLWEMVRSDYPVIRNGRRYSLSNGSVLYDILSNGSYSRLTVEEGGESRVLYDVSAARNAKGAIVLIGAAVVLCVFVPMIFAAAGVSDRAKTRRR